jgi:hypothetical protein
VVIQLGQAVVLVDHASEDLAAVDRTAQWGDGRGVVVWWALVSLLMRTMIVTFCVLVSALLMAGCSVLPDPGGDCTARDRSLAESLNNLAVLQLRPSDVPLQDHGAGYGCTDSTNIPYASRTYRPGDNTVEDVTDFYRRAAPTAGWKLEYADDIDPGQRVYFGARLCFSRSVDAVAAFLSVSFPGDFDDGPDDVLGPEPIDFNLTVSADPDGGYMPC